MDFWRDRPTLVTGATGLLGGWMVRRLLELGADVVCLVRDWCPRSVLLGSDTFAQVRIVHGDVCDLSLVERSLGEYEIGTVFHLAAQAIVGVANRNPVSTFQSNVCGTWVMLEACRRSPLVEQVLVASSDKAYGTQPDLPYLESTPLAGQHPYDVSKSCADLIAQSYAATYELPVCIARCGNLYGGGDLNFNRLVPSAIRSVLQGQRPQLRSNGQMTRDYLYVEDAVAAYILLAEQLARRPDLRGEAYNFSTESPQTAVGMVQAVLSAMKSTAEPMILDHVTHEIAHQYLSAKKARKQLGWRPTFQLDESLKRTAEWYGGYLQSSARDVAGRKATAIASSAA